MEETKKVQKVNLGYTFLYFIVPVIVIAACFGIGYLCDVDGGYIAVALFMGPFAFAALWYVIANPLLFYIKKKQLEKKLDDMGFVRNQTFDSGSCRVVIDMNNRKIALLFRWNLNCPFVFPAERLERAWVDDGKIGSGVMEGSSRVSFLFIVDGVKIRVNTFTSNQRFRMDSEYILTGISKADMMVNMLTNAVFSQNQNNAQEEK